jgi:predicted nucleotidyltransferase/predicted DNA-binding transcriptional regulator
MVKESTVTAIISTFMPGLVGGLTIREISKRAGISYDAAYRHVKALAKSGIIREMLVGRATVCSLDLHNISARKRLEEISVSKTGVFLGRDIVLKKMLGELVENLRRVASNELLCIVLFGSYARGEQKEQSDVDVLIVSSTFGIRGRVEQECGGIGHRYGKPIAPLLTTASEFVKMLKSKKRMVAHEVQQDGIILYGFENYFVMLGDGVSND